MPVSLRFVRILLYKVSQLRNAKLNYRINHQISASELRVIGPDGKQIGVLNRSEAQKKADELNLDLIEIAPKAKPPVAKIESLGKFRYHEEKKLKKQKKGAKSGELKEIRFSPFIAPHDYDVRLERIKEFLDENNKVRVVVVFKGRQMGNKDFGYDILDKVTKAFVGRIVIDMDPKFLGRHLAMVISPTHKIIKPSDTNTLEKAPKDGKIHTTKNKKPEE